MSDIVVSLPSDPGLREALAGEPGVEFVEWDLEGPAPRADIDIVVPQYMGSYRRVSRVAGVNAKLIQWQAIGYDGVADVLPAGIPFANGATVHEASTAELALGLILASQRRIPEFVRQGDEGRWGKLDSASLADRRVLLIGYGGVCKAVEARIAPFEVEVVRLARTARTDTNLAGEPVPVHGFDELGECLAQADIVVLAVPLTDETRGLMDAAALSAMPDGALLVNIARGPVVDTGALIAELQEGRLRAALDVTDPEPLPAEHPLWSCPGALITPHVGGFSSAMLPRIVALIRRQIAHIRAGETPENLVLGI